MNRTRVLSGLVGLGLLVGLALGQQPPPTDKPTEKKGSSSEAKAPAKGSLEEAIASALKHNPDVRVAEAEVQVAQAKLAQAKLAVAQKVAAAHAAIDRAKAEAKAAEETFSYQQALAKKGFSPKESADAARLKLEQTKSAVATAEAEYNALLGVIPGAAAVKWGEVKLIDRQPFVISDLTVDQGTILLGGVSLAAPTATGSVADKLRAGLDKLVQVGSHDTQPLGTFLEWLNQQASLDLTFRVKQTTQVSPSVSIKAGTLSVGAILQLIEDDNSGLGLRFVLREYGILATDAKTLPPGAITVMDFWKQVRMEQAREKEKKEPPKK